LKLHRLKGKFYNDRKRRRTRFLLANQKSSQFFITIILFVLLKTLFICVKRCGGKKVKLRKSPRENEIEAEGTELKVKCRSIHDAIMAKLNSSQFSFSLFDGTKDETKTC